MMRNPRRRFLIYDHEPRLSAGSKVKNQLFQSDFSHVPPFAAVRQHAGSHDEKSAQAVSHL